jgi:phosphoglycolate phosphatase-like HAD superfamily hydrolase
VSQQVAVFFDLDGTLVDLNPEPAELEQLRGIVSNRALSAGVSVDDKSILKVYQRVVTERGFDHPVSKRMRLDLDAFETRWAQNRSAIKWGVHCLSNLCRKRYMAAIVTSNGLACLQALFHADKLKSEWFDFAVTRDNVPLLKPSRIPLEFAWHLAQQRSVDLSRGWLVGDSEHDQEATEAFNRYLGSKLTFVRVDGSLDWMSQSACYADLDGFLKYISSWR